MPMRLLSLSNLLEDTKMNKKKLERALAALEVVSILEMGEVEVFILRQAISSVEQLIRAEGEQTEIYNKNWNSLEH